MKVGPKNPLSPLKTFLWVDERTFVAPKVEKLGHLLGVILGKLITVYYIRRASPETVLESVNPNYVASFGYIQRTFVIFCCCVRKPKC